MSKKRKLNSKNPKYQVEQNSNAPVIKKRILMCNAKVRDANGKVVEGRTAPVYGVWYE